MVNIDNFNETKSLVILILKSYNLNDQKIDEMVTDNFINGFLELAKLEPENNQFLNLARNFPAETNLNDIEILDKSFRNEITSGGYFCDVLQYVIDSWRSIDLSLSPLSRSVAEDIGKGKIAGGVALGLAGVSPATRGILGTMASYAQIAVGAYEQEEKIQNILKNMDDELWRVATGIHKNFTTAKELPSPLIIDLDGDGVETLGTGSNVYFDHDGNGFAENAGWVGKDDGILVRDLNNNGTIDNGAELFGNNSVLASGKKAANGFEALKDLDSNKDGIFNASDTAWNDVKVWKDANGNGILDNGELLSLAQANIAGINLNYTNQTVTDANGNQHSQTGTITKTDGATSTITDVWFDADYADTVDKTQIEIPDDIKLMPNLEGFGNVHSLQIAMALDTTGELKTLAQQYAAETDPAARDVILINLIYHWAGVQNLAPNGRNPTKIYGNVLGDSRKLEALEEFMGEDYLGMWCWGERDPNPHGVAAPYILQAFDDLKKYIATQLNAQTHYKDLLDSVTLTYNEASQTWEANVSATIETLRAIYETDALKGYMALQEFSAIISKYKGFSEPVIDEIKSFGNVDGTAFEKYLLDFDNINNMATIRNDTLYGTDTDNYLNGDFGNDRLYGGDGNDILVGGEGDDYLVGEHGADTYHFEVGFGNDSIDNMLNEKSEHNQDVIEFGEGILKEKVLLERQGFDLIIKVSYDNRKDDSLRVFSYFNKHGTTSATVSQIKFADGTSWNYDYVLDNFGSIPGAGGGTVIEGSDENDQLYGTDYDDIIIGNDGNDTIFGIKGNKVIVGGKGNDLLYNYETGNDSYIWNLGDGLDTVTDNGGNDKIIFGEGITASDLSFCVPESDSYYPCYDLKIYVNNDVNQGIIITNYFQYDSRKIETLQFADGSTVNLPTTPLTLHQTDTVDKVMLTNNGDTIYAAGGDDRIDGGTGDDKVYGGAGNDTIYVREGNNLISGDGGNDVITADTGNDTYLWNLGDGLDTVTDNGGNDKIIFGEGITASDLSFNRNGNALNLTINGDSTQGISINDFYVYDNKKLENVEFADGSSMNLSDASLLVQALSTFGSTNSGSTDTLSNPTQNVSEMYALAASNDLNRKVA